MKEQIAGFARAQVLHALAAQAEGLAGLSALGQRDSRFSRQSRDRDFSSERRSGKGDREFGMKIVSVTRKDVVRLDHDFNIQVPRLSAVHAWFSTPGHADALTVVDAGRNLDLHDLGRANLADTLAVWAGVGDDLPGAVAFRASLMNLEKTVGDANGAVPLTSRTCSSGSARLAARALSLIHI